jgi:heme/copper-type cytochrome/quinol oxidase subunit 2
MFQNSLIISCAGLMIACVSVLLVSMALAFAWKLRCAGNQVDQFLKSGPRWPARERLP